jgi:glucose-1-phosphate adenylyltransferase
MPSSFISRDAVTEDSLIAEGCEIFGIVRHSVISTGCTIEAGALIEDSVIMPNVHIKSDAIIRNAIIGEDVQVCRGAIIGGGHESPDEERSISVISKGSVIKEGVTVAPGVVR